MPSERARRKLEDFAREQRGDVKQHAPKARPGTETG
jgi:hypothetical protein